MHVKSLLTNIMSYVFQENFCMDFFVGKLINNLESSSAQHTKYDNFCLRFIRTNLLNFIRVVYFHDHKCEVVRKLKKTLQD